MNLKNEETNRIEFISKSGRLYQFDDKYEYGVIYKLIDPLKHNKHTVTIIVGGHRAPSTFAAARNLGKHWRKFTKLKHGEGVLVKIPLARPLQATLIWGDVAP